MVNFLWVLSICAVVPGSVLLTRRLIIHKRGYSTLATIIDYEESKDDEGILFYDPIIVFKLTNNKTKKITLGSAQSTKRKSNTIQVIHYDNGKEEFTLIDSFISKFLSSIVLLLIGAILSIFLISVALGKVPPKIREYDFQAKNYLQHAV